MRDAEPDEELKTLAREEIASLETRETALIDDLRVSLLPRDPNDDRNVIVEIRAGAGGEEAALFATELLRMYSRYAQEHRFQTDLMSLNETGIGGTKEAILEVAGDGAYSRLKFEGGVHRVQRVPSTESSGRIHTSTATVIVLPEVDEVEVDIDEAKDLRIDVKRSSGPGRPVGQHDRLRGPDHAPPHGAGRRDPGREEPAQEQGEGDGRAALPPVRPGAREAAGGAERRAPADGRRRRPVREDPDLQLPRQPGHRPPHRGHDPQRAGRPRGPARPADRRPRDGRPGRPPEPPHRDERTVRRRDGPWLRRRTRPPAGGAGRAPTQVAGRRCEATRFFDPVVRPIVKATDLGSVQVLKQGNLYLLSDPFGDVHPDSRGLGLYDGDTRRLSASILRVNGERPVLLQASAGGNYHGAIQLTNPRLERNVADKVRPEDALASQKLGIGRKRVIAGGMLEERVRIVNYAEVDEQVEVTLELAADAADIFEVRGWTRVERGRQLPIATRRDRVTFRYDGLDGRRTSHARRVRRARRHRRRPVEPDVAGSVNAGWVRLTWHWPLASGDARELRWLDLVGRGAADAEGRQGRRRPRPRRRAVPARARARPSTRSPRRTTRGTAACPRSGPTTSWSTSPSTARPATSGCWSTTARARASDTWPPACRGSRRCSAATR